MNNNLTTIGIFGAVNSGKSTLFNKLINQDLAIVSDIPGTTTDSVIKLIELGELGRVKLIDTAGIGDNSLLGDRRLKGTLEVAKTVDVAIIVKAKNDTYSEQITLTLKKYNTPYLTVINKGIAMDNICSDNALVIDYDSKNDIQVLIQELLKIKQSYSENLSITGSLAKAGDTVVLVMPQDKSAPDGRLILPQSQTIKELLDKNCVAICVTPDKLKMVLDNMKEPPNLVITDSSVYDVVWEILPKYIKLSSFSVLFAKLKGDIDVFMEGSKALDKLHCGSKVLIAEACSHTPKNEDIGSVKLPRLIKQVYGEGVIIDIVNGLELPNNLKEYDVIIHCGACMFSRKTVMNRIIEARLMGVPITNYGIAIAKLNGILNKIVY